jgi:tRNA1Val (adenine37-N6)-methyltransferase
MPHCSVELNPDEDLSVLPHENLSLIQARRGYRVSFDSFFLADFTDLHGRRNVLEFGAGSGVLAILLTRKYPHATYTAVEIQESLARRAARNLRLNDVPGVSIVLCDLARAPAVFPSAFFDAVICNPPYRKAGTGRLSPVSEKAIARHEIQTSLPEILRAAETVLCHGGSFFFIHRDERRAETDRLLRFRTLRPTRFRVIRSFPGSTPDLFMMECTKGSAGAVREIAPLVIYRSPGVYTDEAARLLGKRHFEPGAPTLSPGSGRAQHPRPGAIESSDGGRRGVQH